MPRTVTDTLKILTNRKPLSTDEWYELIEARKELIGPYLDRFTLRELRSVDCLYHEGHFGPLGYAKTVRSRAGLSLETQGLFGHDFKSRKKTGLERGVHTWYADTRIPANGKLSIWGLTRKKQWIIAIVSYEGSAGYKDRGREDPTQVRIEEVALPAMVKLSRCKPKEIWLALGEQFRQFVEIRRAQYEDMRSKADDMVVEDMLANQF